MWEGKRETNLRRILENPEVAECGQLPSSHGLQVNCLNSDTPMNPQIRTRLLRVKLMEMQRRKTLFDLETQATILTSVLFYQFSCGRPFNFFGTDPAIPPFDYPDTPA